MAEDIADREALAEELQGELVQQARNQKEDICTYFRFALNTM